MKNKEIDLIVNDHLAAVDSGKKFDVCVTYKTVKPILKVARGLLFWKPKWQKVLDLLMASLDSVCNDNS